MSDTYSTLCDHISDNRLIGPGMSILAAVSGGADSMCMLALLIRYARENEHRLGVIHVDHGFRPEAAEEAAYVKEFCEARDIPFFLKKIEPGTCDKTEEAARIRRYELISETADKERYDLVALAHNANDRAETMLFNLFRGTGIKGLTSIRPVRDRYIRPILCLKRDEIERYLKDEGIRYYTDSTNLEDDYSRNRIRHHVIPEACTVNSRAIEHMNGLARDAEEICDLTASLAKKAYDESVRWEDEGPDKTAMTAVTDVNTFIPLHPVIQREVIRLIIFSMTPHLKDIEREHIDAVCRLFTRSSNGSVDLPYGICASREYGEVRISKSKTDKTDGSSLDGTDNGILTDGINVDLTALKPGESMPVEVPGAGNIVFSLIEMGINDDKSVYMRSNEYTKCFDYDKINKFLTIRQRAAGDRITIDEKGHSKDISGYMIDKKIPERLRDNILMIADGSDIIWIIGHRDSYAYRIGSETTRILKITSEVTDG